VEIAPIKLPSRLHRIVGVHPVTCSNPTHLQAALADHEVRIVSIQFAAFFSDPQDFLRSKLPLAKRNAAPRVSAMLVILNAVVLAGMLIAVTLLKFATRALSRIG